MKNRWILILIFFFASMPSKRLDSGLKIKYNRQYNRSPQATLPVIGRRPKEKKQRNEFGVCMDAYLRLGPSTRSAFFFFFYVLV